MNESFFVKATPWKESIFDLSATVITNAGKEDAVETFREHFKNHNLEPNQIECTIIIVSKNSDKQESSDTNPKVN